MGASNRLIVSILVIAALAIAFWMLLLGPQREQADELGAQAEQMQVSLEEAQGKAAEAEAARHAFPADYGQLVVLGKAVPASDETSSLLVQLNQIATRSKVRFDSILLTGQGETSTPLAGAGATAAPLATSTGAVPASATVPPTEAAASVLPLGASIGPAGLAVMPYSLSFTGSFFHVADFIKGIDSLVHTGGSTVAVNGRLVTIDGFALNADSKLGFPALDATFAVTTYLTPPSQGITAGATPTAPTATTAAPAAQPEPAAATSETATSETASAR
jgi:Tfp pilus assembly protein PilO